MQMRSVSLLFLTLLISVGCETSNIDRTGGPEKAKPGMTASGAAGHAADADVGDVEPPAGAGPSADGGASESESMPVASIPPMMPADGEPVGDGYVTRPCPSDDGGPVAELDLLIVVDDGSTMREEQAGLRAALPSFLSTLTSGEHAFTDIHLGVVSGDLGAVGVEGIDGCAGLGDDGFLQHDGAPGVAECTGELPMFLSFDAGSDDAETFAHDAGCLASLGVSGCAVRQPLESGLKALWPSLDRDSSNAPQIPNRVQFIADVDGTGTLGQGDRANAGFLRSDPPSVLAVLVVSDREDCSNVDPLFLVAGGSGVRDPRRTCLDTPVALYSTMRYRNALLALRPFRERMVVFGAIGGMPAGSGLDIDWKNAAARADFYSKLLSEPSMNAGSVICASPRGNAYPSRRVVEIAQGFTSAGFVSSICDEDYTPALERFAAVIKLAGERGDVCDGASSR